MNRHKCRICGKKINKRSQRCRTCEMTRRHNSGMFEGKKHPSFKHGKCLIKKYCIDCNKLLGKNATFYNNQRCCSCSTKHLFKIGKLNQSGNQSSQYKDGRSIGKHYCIDCKKEISNYKTKRCWKCYVTFNRGKNHSPKPKNLKLSKNTIIKHHVNLNKGNNRKNNKLILTQSIHVSLHHRAYKYLVRLGIIRNYIKWFINNELTNKQRKLIRKLNDK
jgi:hypothetical protein